MSEKLTIDRGELFGEDMDRALATRRAALGASAPPPPPISAFRRMLYSNLFYLPAAAIIGAMLTWMLLEPNIQDFPVVAGQVDLINEDPFNAEGYTSLTIGTVEVYLDYDAVFEAGAEGEPAIESLYDITVGDYIEVAGFEEISGENRIVAAFVRPTSASRADEIGTRMPGSGVYMFFLFPLTATLIALCVLFAEGVASRNWSRAVPRMFLGALLAAVFSVLGLIPGGLVFVAVQGMIGNALAQGLEGLNTVDFLLISASRSMAWAMVGAGLGLGMNLVRSTRMQLRNAVIGGALGGAFGGMFFDAIDRFFVTSNFEDASMSRLIGLLAVGLGVGIFMALVDRFARTAWLRVRTGPLAGKAFVLYRTPTTVGSSPDAHIYLFKDAEIDALHAQIHRIGSSHEVEDMGSRHGTKVADRAVRRRRLVSGDQIVVGNTILEFEERSKQSPAS
jgi:hypothetical protein